MKRLAIGIFVFMLGIACTTETTRADTRLWKVSDTTELQQAIAELKAVGGYGTIILAPGTYLMSETVAFNVHYVSLTGSGWNTVWQKVGDGNAIVFEGGASRATVRDMKIAGDPSAAEGSGIIIQTGCTMVNRCLIEGFPRNGIRFEETPQSGLSCNTVSNCQFIGNCQEQLYSSNNNDFYIVGNQFSTCSGVIPGTGVVLDNSSAGTYANNHHCDSTVALRMTGCKFNRIENNHFEKSRESAIVIGDPNGGLWDGYYNILLGNTIRTSSISSWGEFTAVVAYGATNITFWSNHIFNQDGSPVKRCLEIGSGCGNWIVKKNIMYHSKEPSVISYDENAGHIIKDNITICGAFFEGDINKDGKVDIEDLMILSRNWLTGT